MVMVMVMASLTEGMKAALSNTNNILFAKDKAKKLIRPDRMGDDGDGDGDGLTIPGPPWDVIWF